MLKSATQFGIVFCAGIVLGLALATWGRSAPATEPQVPQPGTASVPAGPVTAPPLVSAPPSVPERLDAKLSALSQQVAAATASRQRLQDELRQVQETVQTLQQRLDELTEAEPVDNRPPVPVANTRRNRAETFVDAGFDPDEAEYLANRMGQQQMDLLYLRDQAIREGWINTARYEQEARDLRNGTESIREELGPEAYDQFLYASGQANRVVLNSIIDSSPAQDIGLQPGDQVLSYDGNRVFNVNDLRNATTVGEPDEPVVIEVIRDGQRLEFEIARGPIGVTLGRERSQP